MFKKENRLLKKKDFDNVFKQGKSKFSRILGVKALKNNTKNNRYGIIVGKKISKKAVQRNQVKRRIREIVRVEFQDIKTGNDIIILTLPPVLDSDYQNIKKSLYFCFKKLDLL